MFPHWHLLLLPLVCCQVLRDARYGYLAISGYDLIKCDIMYGRVSGLPCYGAVRERPSNDVWTTYYTTNLPGIADTKHKLPLIYQALGDLRSKMVILASPGESELILDSKYTETGMQDKASALILTCVSRKDVGGFQTIDMCVSFEASSGNPQSK